MGAWELLVHANDRRASTFVLKRRVRAVGVAMPKDMGGVSYVTVCAACSEHVIVLQS